MPAVNVGADVEIAVKAAPIVLVMLDDKVPPPVAVMVTDSDVVDESSTRKYMLEPDQPVVERVTTTEVFVASTAAPGVANDADVELELKGI